MKSLTLVKKCALFLAALASTVFWGCGSSSNDNTTPDIAVAPIVVLTKMTVLPGQETAARNAIVSFVTETHKEPGVISYDVYQGNGIEDHTYWFREVWKDQAAIATHFGTPQFGALVSVAPSLFSAQFTGGDGTPGYFVVTTQATTASAKSLRTGAVTIDYLKANSGKDATAGALLTTLVQASAAEAGNVSADLFKYEAAYGMPEGTYQIFAQWQGSNAYDIHLSTPATLAYKSASAGLFAAETSSFATMVTTPKTLAYRAEQIAIPQPITPEVKNTLKEYSLKMSGK